MVQPTPPKRLLAERGGDEGERPKRQNSGEMMMSRPRSRRMSSEESEYTTDETSDEEEDDGSVHSGAVSATSRKSSKAPRRWQPSEDRRLAESVRQHGEANWKAIAARVGSRNHVQCLQRWKKVLRPGLVKGQWSAKEDAVLMKLACSGYKNWGVLSNHMPGRTSKQCRERWCHHLDPSINKSAYTPREDKIIIETQARLGNKWSQIAARLPGRTENSIKIRCKALQRKGTGAPQTSSSTRTAHSRKVTSTTSSRHSLTSSASADSGEEPRAEAIDMSAPTARSATTVRFSPRVDKFERSASWSSSDCSPAHKSRDRGMPFSPAQSPFFKQNSGGGTMSTLNPASFSSVAGPARTPAHAPVSAAPTETGNFDFLWRPWPRTMAPVSRHVDHMTPPSTWSFTSSAAAPPSVKHEQSHATARPFADFSTASVSELFPASSAAPIAQSFSTPSAPALVSIKCEPVQCEPALGTYVNYAMNQGPVPASVGGLSADAAVFARAQNEDALGQPVLSSYFELGLSTVMEKSSEDLERGQRYSDERASLSASLGRVGATTVPDGQAGTSLEETVNAIVQTDEDSVENELGDLSTLAVNDLQEAPEVQVDSAAPLRSCCSFLDLPGEGMVLGDMPLSW